MDYSPRSFAPNIEIRAFLLERASTTTFSVPFLWLGDKVKACRKYIHLAFLEFNLGCPLRNLSAG